MEDRETARMRKYGESKTTRIMMATVPHVTSGSGLRKFQADGFLLDRVYIVKAFYWRSWLRAVSKDKPLYSLCWSFGLHEQKVLENLNAQSKRGLVFKITFLW